MDAELKAYLDAMRQALAEQIAETRQHAERLNQDTRQDLMAHAERLNQDTRAISPLFFVHSRSLLSLCSFSHRFSALWAGTEGHSAGT